MLEPVDLTEAPDGKSFQYPYIATLSPTLKLGFEIVSPSSRSKMVKIVEGAVEGIMQTEGVADSLIKGSSLIKSVRQIDIKNDDQKVMFKTFISWDKDQNCWQVFVEGANETYFEDKLKPIGKG